MPYSDDSGMYEINMANDSSMQQSQRSLDSNLNNIQDELQRNLDRISARDYVNLLLTMNDPNQANKQYLPEVEFYDSKQRGAQ